MNYHQAFARLHQGPSPLLLGNCWDVSSAKLLEAAGFAAVGFSSHALATSLGYSDGEQLPFELLVRMTRRVVESISIPFTVDLEGGYSRDVDQILAHIDRVYDAGTAGINLEDTVAGESTVASATTAAGASTAVGSREFLPAQEFAAIIAAIRSHLKKSNRHLFLNIRTDAFLLNAPAPLSETLARIALYERSGADGIFVPCITAADDIEQVVNATPLPVNVMCMPGLPEPEALQRLGVRRISMGPFLFNKSMEYNAALAQQVIGEKTLAPILP